MWRPYLAVIKDSFRAALASRVLYVLLGLITLLLVVLAPLHLREVLDWEISLDQDVRDARALTERLVQRRDRVVIQRIWDRFPPALHDELAALAANPPEQTRRSPNAPPPPPDARYQPLVDALNQILGQRDFYDAEVWKGQFLEEEARQLIDQGVDRLNDDQIRRLNRMLLSRALRPDLLAANLTTIHTMYGPWRLEFLTATSTHQQLARSLSTWVSYVFDKFILSIGLVIAILVTSNLIPEMFEPGSLNLLLSKPVSRWALVLSKFIGGCAFVALLSGYLFLGLWLWLGIDMGIWDRSILLSIPLYIVVFAIYYAVSVLVGIIWRSAVLSVIMTALFWAFCFAVGLVYSLFYNRTHQERLVAMAPRGTDSALLAVDALQRVWSWDATARQWQSLTRLSDRAEDEAGLAATLFFVQLPPLPGVELVFDEQHDVYLRAAANLSDPDSFSQLRLEIAGGAELAFTPRARLPAGSCALLPTPRGPILVTEQGNFQRLDLARLLSAPQAPATEDAPIPGLGGLVDTVRGRDPDLKSYLTTLGPDQPQVIRGARQVAFHAASQDLYVVSLGSVFRYGLEGDSYRLLQERELDTGGQNRSLSAQLACGGERLLVALGNGKLIVLNRQTLESLADFLPERRSAPWQIAASNEGRRFAVNFRNGRTWLIEAGDAWALRHWAPPGIGTHQGVDFDAHDRLWIAHDLDRVSAYALDPQSIQMAFQPSGDVLRGLFRWAIRPIYWVCPKPGEFYKLVQHLSSTSDTRDHPDVDLSESLEYENPWSPLTTGLVFMALCLAVACWAFQRSDY